MKFLFPFIAALFVTVSANAQSKNVQTDTLTVNGICEMCQARIENAAYIKGVKKASWDKETKILTVVYQPKKVTLQEIANSVAMGGHDNRLATASDKAYDHVHHCCKYRTDTSH